MHSMLMHHVILCKEVWKERNMISVIVAASENNVIGKQGAIPWYLSRDLKNFKETTAGNTVIMGRKTFESIIARLGRPLPHRKNVIITRQANFVAPAECIVASSCEDALKKTKGEEVFICGGETVYASALPYADRLYLTRVHMESDGEIKLPQIDFSKWKLIHEEKWEKDEKNEYEATYHIYERIHP
jgi:dihydrofolate reductase